MEVKSPGGFVFGIQGYEYGEVRPRTITFFTDGKARVCDHRGNPIEGWDRKLSHADTITQLKDLGIDWQKLNWAGFPQLSYEELMELPSFPVTPLDELAKIPNKKLRQDAIKARREVDEARAAELEEVEA